MTDFEYVESALVGKSFTDNAGRSWHIRFDTPTNQLLYAACKEYWGVTGIAAQQQIMLQTDSRFGGDEYAARFFVIMVIRQQLHDAGVTVEDMAISLLGDTLEAAISAFQMALEETRNRSQRKWNWLYWARATVLNPN